MKGDTTKVVEDLQDTKNHERFLEIRKVEALEELVVLMGQLTREVTALSTIKFKEALIKNENGK